MSAKTYTVAYLRVSTNEQDVINQRFGIGQYALSKGLIIDKWFEDIVTGKSKLSERSGGFVPNDMPKGCIVIVAEISRLGRSMFDIFNTVGCLLDRKIELHIVKQGEVFKNNVSGKSYLFALSIGAEIERDLISQRTTESLLRKKSEGLNYTKNPPYGYKVWQDETNKNEKYKGSLTKDLKECLILKDIFELNKQGFGARKIASHLNENKYKTRSNKEFKPQWVQQILHKKDFYIEKKIIPAN